MMVKLFRDSVLAKLRASSRGKTRGASVILLEWVYGACRRGFLFFFETLEENVSAFIFKSIP